MIASCPISGRNVDSNRVRAISLQVSLFTTLYLLTGAAFFAAVIFADFSIRAVRKSEFSLFALMGRIMLSCFGLGPKPCDEAPKRFALYLGLVIAFMMLLLHLSGLLTAAKSIAVVLLFCASLETLFDYCIGCKLYQLIQLFKAKIFL